MKTKPNIFFWSVIIIFYFATRLINLKIIPIFTDEAIYSFWAQVALNDPEHRFISLIDGKQPLFIWIAAIFQQFIGDPLIATRMVSVVAGLGSTIGIYLLSCELFSKKVARISALLYVLLPITLLYDKLALFDSLLTMFGIYSIFFTIKLASDAKLDLAFLNGFAIGGALITKSSGFFFLYLIPLSVLLFDKKQKKLKIKFFRYFAFSALSAAIAFFIYNLLRLSPLFYIISQKNYQFIRPFDEVISDPFFFFLSNLSALSQWTLNYLSITLTLFLIAGLILGFYKKNLSVIYLFLLAMIPFSAEVFFNKVLYPRFILFFFPYLIILSSFGFISLVEKYIKYKKIIITLFFISLIIPITSSFQLLTNPTSAKIPNTDSNQYFNDWPAGYGVEEVVQFLKRESKNSEVYVGLEGTFGLFPYALNIYFSPQESINFFPYWPVNHNQLPEEILRFADEGKKSFFIFNENQNEITNQRLKLIAKYQKGVGNSYMRLYEVLPDK